MAFRVHMEAKNNYAGFYYIQSYITYLISGKVSSTRYWWSKVLFFLNLRSLNIHSTYSYI